MTGRQDLFEESMQLGHSAAWDLNWDRAIEFYRKALAESPEHSGALMSLGLALLETGRLREALATYHRATKANPDDAIPFEKCAEIFEMLNQPREAIQQRNAAAKIYLRRKNVDKALENWGHIARMAPDNLQARSQLALAYERLRRRRYAVHEYIALASILQGANKTQQAIEVLQRAQALKPGDLTASNALRVLQRGEKLPAPARPLGITRPLRLKREAQRPGVGFGEEGGKEPQNADPELEAERHALSALAAIMFEEPGERSIEQDDLRSSLMGVRGKTSELAATRQPQKLRYLGEAIDLQTQGHKRKAVKVMQRAVDAGLDRPAAYYNLGILYKAVGGVENARKYLIAALEDKDYALGANLALGRIAHSRGELPESARYLLQAMRQADGMSVSGERSKELNELYDTILASQASGDEETLSQIVESALAFLGSPDWLQRVHRARQRLQSQAPADTFVPLAEMLAVGGSEKVFQDIERIDDYVARGLFDVAMEETMIALQEAPGYLTLHQRMAEILIESGRTSTGIAKISVIADTYLIRGNVEKATEAYQRVVQLSPVNLPARQQLISLLIQQGQIDQALQQYLNLAEICGDMAQIEEKRKTLEEALGFAESQGADREMKLKILRQLVDIDMSRLDLRAALKIYHQMHHIDPEDESISLNIIELNLRLGLDSEAGKELDRHLERLVKNHRGSEVLPVLEELTREHPGKTVLHSRLAKAYQAAGRKAEAISQYDALGELQIDAGKIDEAISTIRTLIALGPPEVDGYRELLRNLESGGS